MLSAGAREISQRQDLFIDDRVGVRSDCPVHLGEKLEGVVCVVSSKLEPSQVEYGFEHMAGLEDGERVCAGAIEVDVLPAQATSQIGQTAVAGDERGLVQGVRAFGQYVCAGSSSGLGYVGDLVNSSR